MQSLQAPANSKRLTCRHALCVRVISSSCRMGTAIVTRLADILVIQAIRNWISTETQGRIGWLHALRDRQIGRALMLIHKQPERAWTLHSLAAEVAMSRSAFAARFTSLTGEPAMQYATQWRMHTAHSMLSDLNISVSELSLKLGYQSEAAFNRAVKRIHGFTPGSVKSTRSKQ